MVVLFLGRSWLELRVFFLGFVMIFIRVLCFFKVFLVDIILEFI